ncbi:hypothetical protein OHB26_19590 [Nocardia sp. NBC_01503]|uniref:hypothetical protein n=1 Tax=Nocardia sp. NBC_01503 TaxID=2975997 RepID=UPI002E7C1EDB|nr:hypothetical protein [Nocardia sp. NBC_01503]WTL29223.1 hypothetical protein OHB26_19590 [Nocardia sp. NBC_01503]
MPTNDDIGDSADKAAADIAGGAGELADKAQAAAGQLAERASGAAAELADRASSAAADLADMAKAFADKINTDDLQGTLEQVRANLEHAAQDVMAAVNEIVEAVKNKVGK